MSQSPQQLHREMSDTRQSLQDPEASPELVHIKDEAYEQSEPPSAASSDVPDSNLSRFNSMGSRAPPDLSKAHQIVLVLVLMCAQLLTQIGVGQVLAPIYIISEFFNETDPGKQAWYIAAYSLTAGTFIISAGRLGDMFGHKRMFMFGYAWLAVWALLTGISRYTNPIFFDFCRGMQGIGPAFLMPNAMAIIGKTYPEGKLRNIVFSLFGACAPGGFMLGATFGALFAQLATWAWALWATAIAAVGVLFLAYFVVPNDDNIRKDEKFDYLGAFTGVGGLILINVAWNQGPSVGWQTPYVYILLIIGALFMVAFAIIETRVAEPLVPLKEMNSSVVRVLLCIACGWATFGIWLFYIWQFVLSLRHLTPLHAVAQFAPVPIMGFVASGLNAFLLSKNTPTSVLMIIAMLGFCIPSILLATMSIHQTYWAETFVGILLAPFGMDISFPAATIMMSNAVPRHRQGIAASLVATVVNYSISLGLGIAGTAVSRVSPGTDEASLLTGIRTAAYVGIGLSGMGILISIYGVWSERRIAQRLAEEGTEDK